MSTLQTWKIVLPEDVTKQILSTMKDLDCKFLWPKESTESSDEDFPTKVVMSQGRTDICRISQRHADWWSENTNHQLCWAYGTVTHLCQQLYWKRWRSSCSPSHWGTFRLLLQAILQPVIKLKGHQGLTFGPCHPTQDRLWVDGHATWQWTIKESPNGSMVCLPQQSTTLWKLSTE